MPIYEYVCANCNTEFEIMRKIKEAKKATSCPKCHASARKQFSSFGCKTGGNLQVSEKPFRKPSGKSATSKK